MLVIIYALVLLAACATARASVRSRSSAPAYPTSRAARRWHAPAGFIRDALCIHRFESSGYAGWHRAWVTWDGQRSSYAGGLQFLESTWLRAGGLGEPWQWSPREQVYRAWRIVSADHGSWSEWGTRADCGLR